MNLRPRRSEEPDINLTPLIDVVFLLLIFFMVSTTFIREAELEVELPEASQGQPSAETRRVEVVIDALGQYRVNGLTLNTATPAALEEALVEAVGQERDLEFTVRADARTPHQAVVTVMDVAARLGFQRLSIPTRLTDEAATR
ncbi:MAG: biopolymer transporter ExbD [Candidatus Competibacteraceae bacterium]|nr:biopolymer transporter ExbD [Candidatus Competibacteraceae bacterium]